MSWNHRVFKEVYTSMGGDTEDSFTIREVYYNEDGSLRNYTVDAMAPHGETLEELKQSLEWMTAALAKPILTDEDFNSNQEDSCNNPITSV